MAFLTPNWVPLKRVCKFPNVLRVYKRAGRGQGSGRTGRRSSVPADTDGLRDRHRYDRLQVSFTAATAILCEVGQETHNLRYGLVVPGSDLGLPANPSYVFDPGATNGSTTATITTVSGGVVTTVAGTHHGRDDCAAGTTPVGTLISAVKGFLMTVKIAVQGESLPGTGNPSPPALPAWIRKDLAAPQSDWQSVQIDITNIPGVRPLRKDGRWVGTPY